MECACVCARVRYGCQIRDEGKNDPLLVEQQENSGVCDAVSTELIRPLGRVEHLQWAL